MQSQSDNLWDFVFTIQCELINVSSWAVDRVEKKNSLRTVSEKNVFKMYNIYQILDVRYVLTVILTVVDCTLVMCNKNQHKNKHPNIRHIYR